MLELNYDAPTNAGKRVASNMASARNQRYTKDSENSISPNDVV